VPRKRPGHAGHKHREILRRQKEKPILTVAARKEEDGATVIRITSYAWKGKRMWLKTRKGFEAVVIERFSNHEFEALGPERQIENVHLQHQGGQKIKGKKGGL